MDTMLQGGLISLAGSGLLWATGELARQRVKGLKSFKKLPNLAGGGVMMHHDAASNAAS